MGSITGLPVDMLKVILIATAVTAALAQWGGGGGGGNWLGNYVIDTLHGFKLEYDDAHNIVIMVNDTDCFITRGRDGVWDGLVENEDLLHYTSEKLYHQIRDGVGLVKLTDEQEAAYNSPIERWECRRKEAWKVENFRPVRPPPTTVAPTRA